MSLLENLEKLNLESSKIDRDLFDKFDVKRGLRNSDGSGVLAGLTNIGQATGFKKENDKIIPTDGQLYYRGINIIDLAKGFQENNRHGFDETIYLLLGGELPKVNQLKEFTDYMASLRELPEFFTQNMILSLGGRDIMNMLARSVLLLYSLDDEAENTSSVNQLNQCLSLIAKFPVITAYSYYSYRHSFQRKTLHIRHPQASLSTAENFLYMMKGENYSKLEADTIDLSLVLHAEHGGGNNSSFTTRVISSSGTDTYSAIAAAIGSLKGPLHGGANIQVIRMMEDIKFHVKNWNNKDEVAEYLRKILRKEAYDKSGKIYGIGHAIYTLSDPRAILLKEKARALAAEKGKTDEFNLYETIEELSPSIFGEFKGENAKIISPNVDFYSGFVYQCIDIPTEIFTPLFAVARIAGWCAHRLEEISFSAKRIIRPAYKNVCEQSGYTPLKNR